MDLPPSFSGAGLVPGDRTKLRLNFNEALDRRSVPGTPAFTVRVKEPGLQFSRLVTVNRAVVSGSSVTLTLASAVASNATSVTVGYDKSRARQGGVGFGPIRDLAGNETASFTNQTVKTDNQAPIFTASGTNTADSTNSAPSGTLVSLKTDRDGFSDPDGDTLTFSVSLSRDDTHTDDWIH